LKILKLNFNNEKNLSKGVSLFSEVAWLLRVVST